MDENTIKNYIQKLEEFEKTLSQDEDNVDENYLKEIESVLMNLSTDASEFVGESVSTNSTKAMLTPILNCNIKKLKDDAVIPTYSKDGDAGMDLTATEIINNTTSQVTYGTGIAVEIPQGYVGLVFPRSSIRKMELELSNSVGVID